MLHPPAIHWPEQVLAQYRVSLFSVLAVCAKCSLPIFSYNMIQLIIDRINSAVRIIVGIVIKVKLELYKPDERNNYFKIGK
jgi:hypothetical protein